MVETEKGPRRNKSIPPVVTRIDASKVDLYQRAAESADIRIQIETPKQSEILKVVDGGRFEQVGVTNDRIVSLYGKDLSLFWKTFHDLENAPKS